MKKKYLITGFSGFVSKHFLEYLSSKGETCEIIGICRSHAEVVNYPNLEIKTYQIDLKDSQLIHEIISSVRPDYILHFAAESSVAYSWKYPLQSFQNNTNIFLNIVESVRASKIKCRILSVGSSEEYGIVDSKTLPLNESQELNPISPYAVARVSQEMLSKIYTKGYGLDIIITRSFNHIGVGQKANFVVSSFAKQVVESIAGVKKEIEVGDLEIIRDFLDVRDVVKAYAQLLKYGGSGEIYNVCSGIGYSLAEILRKIIKISGSQVTYTVNQDLIRPSDNPIIVGSNLKLHKDCHWAPKISIDQSIADIINYWVINLNESK